MHLFSLNVRSYGNHSPLKELVSNSKFHADENVPVVYIHWEEKIPLYLRINIELASRRNNVIVLWNSNNITLSRNEKTKTNYHGNISYLDIRNSEYEANRFASSLYKVLNNYSGSRRAFELRCIQRWFILRDIMISKQLNYTLYADSDSSIFTNALESFKARSHCDAVINVDFQQDKYYWGGAGEASLWSMQSISDFCSFIENMYKYHIPILKDKFERRKPYAIVDMNLLWLWFVAHHSGQFNNWDNGRPFISYEKKKIEDVRLIHDKSFNFSKNLKLPEISTKLNICNGLDVVNRTVFDHAVIIIIY